MVLKDWQSKSSLNKRLPPASQVTTIARKLEARSEDASGRSIIDIPWWQQASRLSHHINAHKSKKVKIFPDDLYLCSRGFLLVGKIFGVIPIEGLWKSNLSKVHFRLVSPATCVSIFEILCTVTLSILSFGQLLKLFFGGQGGVRIGTSVIINSRGPILIVSSSIIHYMLIRNSRRIVRLLRTWRAASMSLLLTTEKSNIFRAVNLLAFGNFILGMVHFFVVQLSGVVAYVFDQDEEGRGRNVTFMEYFYEKTKWCDVIPYNPTAAVFILITRSFTVVTRHFAEGFILLLARLLSFKFQTLYEQARLRISPPKNYSNTMTMFRKTSIDIVWSENLWSDLRRDHLICLQLLHDTDNILSPLVFLSYAVNIYLTCMQIHHGVLPTANGNSLVHMILSAISLVFLVTRLILMSLVMARISESAHVVIKCIQKCPNHLYSCELERLERMLSNSTIGLSGLGCFVVTKAFILVVGSVIFTFQVVLMQTPVDTPEVISNLTTSQ